MKQSCVLVLACFIAMLPTFAQQSTSHEAGEDNPQVRPPVTTADLKIVQRTRQILSDSSRWNRADTRSCPAKARTFSIYCALEKATVEVKGQFGHRGAAMQEARFVIEEMAPGRDYDHRLMDYNNDSRTTFADVQEMLRRLEHRIAKRLAENQR